MSLVPLLLAGLLAADPAEAAPEPGVSVEAGAVTYDPGAERYRLLGGARVRRGDAVLRAGEATYDAATGEITAEGGVLVTDPTRALAADRVRAVLGAALEAERVRAYLKAQPVDLTAATTPETARAAGRNAAVLTGDRLVADAAGRLRLTGARLTLCDCGADSPSWEVRADEADVIPGVRAVLRRPVLHVTPRFLGVNRLVPVPLLRLPWIYVPLGDRQTGLLVPELRAPGTSGPVVGLPLYVTLGRSADLTFTPEYASGGDAVRGPGARLELRWAPAEDASGEVELSYVNDLEREAAGAGGARLAIDGWHAQRLGPATTLAARLALAGDPYWPRDFGGDVLARDAGYQRSSLLVSRRAEAWVLEASAAWLQPFTAGAGYGTFGAGRDVIGRLPAVSAALLPLGLGPLALEGRAGLTRFAPASAAVDRSGRPAATRADARLELSLPLLIGDAVALRPFARGAGAAYAFEDGASPEGAAWGLGGVTLSTDLARRYGALRHVISPRAEWRAGSGAAGAALDTPAYDGFDRSAAGVLSAAPPGRFHQLRLAVETRLAAGAATPLRLEAGQDLDLEAGRAGETFVSAAVAAGPFAADGVARFLAIDDRAEPAQEPAVESGLDRFTELRANAALGLGRRLALRGGFLSVGPGGSSALVAGPDALFDLRPAAVGAAGHATAGARASLGAATLDYEALLAGRPRFEARCGDPARQIGAGHVYQHAASFAWDSPCRCFRLAVTLRVNDCGEVGYTARFELARPSAGR